MNELTGTRVRLVRCTDEWTMIKPGTLGTISFVDDLGTLHVKWDDGSHLGLVYEAGDRWEIVPRETSDDDRLAERHYEVENGGM